jgi:peptidoglycan lytic transglycosylase D
MRKILFALSISFCMFILSACIPSGSSSLQFNEPFIAKPSNTLRVGLFKHRDSAPLMNRDIEPLEESPQVIWTRMRQGFEFDFKEHNPRIKKFINDLSRSNYYANKLSKNAAPYMHLIVEEIEKRGIPLEIALLPMIESNFEPVAISRSGADGLWQIMPATGKILGLKQNYWYDGRRDVKASTLAALNHLQYLHRAFDGDWLHALAAYNSGERRVMRAIARNKKQQKPTDFWNLQLPQETKDYVPKLLALITIVKTPAKFGVTLPSIPNVPYAQVVQINHQIDLKIAANLMDMKHPDLHRLNPALHHGTTPPKGPHQLLVPIQYVDSLTKQIRRQAPSQLVANKRYQIKPGDTLSNIAKSFDTNVASIISINELGSNTIYPGQFLYIPGYEERTAITHVVRSGDSLWSISKKYKIALNELISWNNLEKDKIKPGQKLIIYQA